MIKIRSKVTIKILCEHIIRILNEGRVSTLIICLSEHVHFVIIFFSSCLELVIVHIKVSVYLCIFNLCCTSQKLMQVVPQVSLAALLSRVAYLITVCWFPGNNCVMALIELASHYQC